MRAEGKIRNARTFESDGYRGYPRDPCRKERAAGDSVRLERGRGDHEHSGRTGNRRGILCERRRAQNEAADQLAVCQQTNTLATQGERNTNSILNAIAGQNTLITKEFCDLKERELQNKINTQGDIITQLRGQISNDKQTEAFNAAIRALDDKIDAIAAKQPNTVPVTWPNLVAANATPYVGGYGYGYGMNNGFGGSIVF